MGLFDGAALAGRIEKRKTRSMKRGMSIKNRLFITLMVGSA